MKKIAATIITILIMPLFLSAQNKGNSHFFKLLITNDKNEMLLINFDGEWEIPGSRYKTNVTIPEYLDKMAADHGVSIKDPALKALVTFHHDVRELPTMMFYYSAKYVDGDLMTPSWGDDVKWVAQYEAYELIPYPEMNYILKAIRSQGSLLTGAFRITYDPGTKKRVGFEVIDDLK